MIPNVLPPSQEVKFKDRVTIGTVPANSGFTIIDGSVLPSILLGPGANDRIGRNIRVVGVVVRALVNTDVVTGSGALYAPSTMDLVWDNQCNGVAALVSDMYSNPTQGHSLPNPIFDNRFKFAKRSQIKQPQGTLNLVDFSYTCNKLIEYKVNVVPGTVADLTSTNLYLVLSTPGDATSVVEFSIRVLYVDA